MPDTDDVDFIRAGGPNILMVMSDQHRADWLGCAGASWVSTPNIDALAERGVRFSRAVCNSPLCAPSRSALASGLRCSSVRVLANSDLYPLEIPTYYQLLRAAGYRVGCVGKTDLHKRDHWEGANGDRPIMYHLGFTDPMETEGKQSAARYALGAVCPYTRHLVERGLAQAFHDDYHSRGYLPGRSSVLPLDAYHDDFVGRKACEFLRKVGEETPWHYFVSFVGPHAPWDAPSEYSSKCDPADMPAAEAIMDPMEGKPKRMVEANDRHSRLLNQATLAEAMRQYAGMITLIDEYVGRFVDILQNRGQLENTVIVYTSDHGEMIGDHGLFGKSVYYEAALRVPLIFAGPTIKATGGCDALVHLNDSTPTLLELAGLEIPTEMQASSLVPLLRGSQKKLHDVQVSELTRSRMLFDGRFKFAEHDGDLDELYDLRSDPKEVCNMALSEEETAERMREELHRVVGSPR